MANRDIIVIGGSAGAIEALKSVVGSIPNDIPAAMFVVVHVGAASEQRLPSILAHASGHSARLAADESPFEHGSIYVAPRDRHLVLQAHRMRVLRGPKENNHRPAIDALFRSAAWTYGPRVIAVVLSGSLDDGAAGLWAVKERGGVTVVQSPDDALFADMPRNALRDIDVDHELPASEIGALLGRLASESPSRAPGRGSSDAAESTAKSDALMHDHDLAHSDLGQLSAFTCPGCGGALWELADGVLRYRCHTDHAFSAETLLEERSESIERALYSALRALKEKASLNLRIADRLQERFADLATKHRQDADEATRQAFVLREMLTARHG